MTHLCVDSKRPMLARYFSLTFAVSWVCWVAAAAVKGHCLPGSHAAGSSSSLCDFATGFWQTTGQDDSVCEESTTPL